MSSSKTGLFKLRGITRNYDWGGHEFLSKLLSRPNPANQPMAEYWLGAHDTGSSIVLTNEGEIPLNEFISKNKNEILGEEVARRFGRLPFLLKILDVKDMLSIQVHPSKRTAELEFEKENEAHIPVSATNRNYKDDNHKPELMVALSDFWLLHGFKPVKVLEKMLETIPEFRPLLEIFSESGYDQLYKTVMEMPQASVNEILQPVIDRVVPAYKQQALQKNDENFWAARASISFNQGRDIDRGIFSVYFFNLVNLKMGEGIFQDAGLPHAYLEGQNVEIMANSDNVLRGGLTKKHIDVKELMKNIRFEETRPAILHPEISEGCGKFYRTPAPDFRLELVLAKKGEVCPINSATAEILLITKGKLRLSCSGTSMDLQEGEAALLASNQQVGLVSEQGAALYRASVPVHTSE